MKRLYILDVVPGHTWFICEKEVPLHGDACSTEWLPPACFSLLLLAAVFLQFAFIFVVPYSEIPFIQLSFIQAL